MLSQSHPLDRSAVADATRAVRDAGRLSLRWYRTVSHRQAANKNEPAGRTGFDPVTEADRAVEEAVRAWLTDRYPDHGIVGEELGRSEGLGSEYDWIIDPIDGTRAFITGQPMWGTLVGLRRAGVPVAGWMYLPVLDESYVAVHDPETGDRQAYLIEHRNEADDGSATGDGPVPLQVSATTRLSDAVVLSTHPTMFAPGDEADAFAAVADSAKMVRYSGDCVNYGLLAMGLADLVIENQLADYDIMPLLPLITAAGGTVTYRAGGFVIAAATAELHDAAATAFAGVF